MMSPFAVPLTLLDWLLIGSILVALGAVSLAQWLLQRRERKLPYRDHVLEVDHWTEERRRELARLNRVGVRPAQPTYRPNVPAPTPPPGPVPERWESDARRKRLEQAALAEFHRQERIR